MLRLVLGLVLLRCFATADFFCMFIINLFGLVAAPVYFSIRTSGICRAMRLQWQAACRCDGRIRLHTLLLRLLAAQGARR